MNKLPIHKKTQILSLLVEGNSLRAATRITGISRTTILKFLVEVGRACQEFHNTNVVNLKSERLQCDEIWSFVGCKEKAKQRGASGDGDVWTWTALDADSKLIVSWLVGRRDADYACEFMYDVKDRLVNRVQLTTDGHKAYLVAWKRLLNIMLTMQCWLKCTAAAKEQPITRESIVRLNVLAVKKQG